MYEGWNCLQNSLKFDLGCMVTSFFNFGYGNT